MQDKRVFVAAFLVLGFVMKVVVEGIHEVLGHGLFVLLFGGEITQLHISVLWPYEFSYISWSLPSAITSGQIAWIYAGGILVCLCTSFLAQVFQVMKREIRWYFALALFWLAFWTLVSSTGYLLLGGLAPFGDVYELIRLGVLTSLLSFIIGFVTFAIGFAALSQILKRMLIRVISAEHVSLCTVLFWLVIPVISAVMLANPDRSLQLAYMPLAFVPSLLLFVIYFILLRKHEAYANPNDIA